MTIIDDFTAACETQLPLDDRAQLALALVDEAFCLLYGPDASAWLPKQRAAYERAIAEVRDDYTARRRLGDAA